MNHCCRCLLPETFFSARLDDQHLCALCREYDQQTGRRPDLDGLRARFDTLVRTVAGRGKYDLLMSYSGGKDSTRALAWLKDTYALRILAVTFDNGFLPEHTLANIRTVVEALDVDSLIIKPRFSVLRRVFSHCLHHDIFPRKTLERATTLCTACMAVIKFGCLRLALDQGIPLVAYGWSPGQIPGSAVIMKNNPATVRLTQQAVAGPLARLVGDALDPYFLPETYLDEPREFPYNIAPLCLQPYSESEIRRIIARLGWTPPQETDDNSTNCLLNTVAVRHHIARHGFHPYASEIASLIRQGFMTRDEGRCKLTCPDNSAVVALVEKRLGLTPARPNPSFIQPETPGEKPLPAVRHAPAKPHRG